MFGQGNQAKASVWDRPAATHVGLLFVQLAFGLFHVLAKDLMGSVSPLALAGWRVTMALPLLFLMAWRIERVRPTWRDMPHLALLGLLGIFANQLLFLTGLKHTTATNAGILMPTIPVFTVAAAALLRIERPRLGKIAGIVLTVAGALVMLDLASFSLEAGHSLGNGLIVLNCMCYSVFLVLQKPLLRRLPPLTVIAWSFLFGAVMIVALAWPQMADAARAGLSSTRGSLELGYIVLVGTVLTYQINTWAVRRSSSSLVAAYTNLQTVTTAALALPLLGESIGLRELAGFLLIVAGLYVVSRSREGNGGRSYSGNRSN